MEKLKDENPESIEVINFLAFAYIEIAELKNSEEN